MSKINVHLSLLVVFILLGFSSKAQKRKPIHIEQADKMQFNKNIIANANRILGNVKITHDDIIMWCDSAYSYTDTNIVDAFGEVHIIKSDTLHLYAKYINYNGDIQWAKAKRNVKLVNRNTTLTTDTLYYNMGDNIGYYDNYGTIVDSTNTLYSKIGEYYVNLDKVYFKKDVKGKTPSYNILSDTLVYEPSTGISSIVGPTTCYNETDTLYAQSGMYNTKLGYLELHKFPVVHTEKQEIIAKSIFYNKAIGDFTCIVEASIHDYPQKLIVKGEKIEYNEFKEVSFVTDSAHALFYSNVDTLYLRADTLQTIPDTIPGEKILLGYHKIQFHKPDIQGKCDSISYFSVDSTLQMYNQPIIWSQGNQLSSDYMEMVIIDSTYQKFNLDKNSFIISQEDTARFNQIKGRNMVGHIRNNQLYRINVDGNGESLYYAKDSKGIIGLNKAMGSSITIDLDSSKVKRIAFHTKPDGQLIPPTQVSDIDKKLSNFKWQDEIRPITKYDIFYTPEQRKNLSFARRFSSNFVSKRPKFKISDYPKPAGDNLKFIEEARKPKPPTIDEDKDLWLLHRIEKLDDFLGLSPSEFETNHGTFELQNINLNKYLDTKYLTNKEKRKRAKKMKKQKRKQRLNK